MRFGSEGLTKIFDTFHIFVSQIVVKNTFHKYVYLFLHLSWFTIKNAVILQDSQYKVAIKNAVILQYSQYKDW